MKLFIVPGGGDPESSMYKAGFDLIKAEAAKRGLNEVSIFSFPGHFSRDGGEGVLNQEKAARIVEEKLLETEELSQPYCVFSRSYGCGVTMDVLLEHPLPNLKCAAFWGPTPSIDIYKVTVRDQEAIEQAKREKGCYVDETTYESCIPIDIQLLNYTGSHVLHLAAGGKDVHCRPVFFDFLLNYLGDGPHVTYKLISGLHHEVTEYDDAFIDFVFGNQCGM